MESLAANKLASSADSWNSNCALKVYVEVLYCPLFQVSDASDGHRTFLSTAIHSSKHYYVLMVNDLCVYRCCFDSFSVSLRFFDCLEDCRNPYQFAVQYSSLTRFVYFIFTFQWHKFHLWSELVNEFHMYSEISFSALEIALSCIEWFN